MLMLSMSRNLRYGAYYNFHPDQLGRDDPKMYSGCCSTYQILQNDLTDFGGVSLPSSYRTCLQARMSREIGKISKNPKKSQKIFFSKLSKMASGGSQWVSARTLGVDMGLWKSFSTVLKKIFFQGG